MSEAEPLQDFIFHLEGGIEKLKTSSSENSNLLTFLNEVSQFSEISSTSLNSDTDYMLPSSELISKNIILTNIHGESDFMSQITEVHKKLKKEGRHPLGRNGVYHTFGIIKFAAYKWLNKIKSRKDKQNKIQTLPSTYTHSMAKN